MLGLGAVDPGVVAVHGDGVFAQGRDDVDHASVAQVRAVFLEGEAENLHAAVADADAALEHELHHGLGDMGAHAVVIAIPAEPTSLTGA